MIRSWRRGRSPLGLSSHRAIECEIEVFEAVGRGGSVTDIAEAVCLAPGTTRNYLSSAMRKVGAGNRFEAYMIARERGWI